MIEMGKEKKYDLTYLKTISNNDEDFIKEMISSFLENTPQYYEDIQKYYQEKKFDFLFKAVHKFIPTLAFVGANEKNEEFNRLEKLALEKEDKKEMHDLINELKSYCDLVVQQLKTDFYL